MNFDRIRNEIEAYNKAANDDLNTYKERCMYVADLNINRAARLLCKFNVADGLDDAINIVATMKDAADTRMDNELVYDLSKLHSIMKSIKASKDNDIFYSRKCVAANLYMMSEVYNNFRKNMKNATTKNDVDTYYKELRDGIRSEYKHIEDIIQELLMIAWKEKENK